MDASSDSRLSPGDHMGSNPLHEAGTDDRVERLCPRPPKSPQKRFMQRIYPAEEVTPRRRSARLARTSTPVRSLNLGISTPQVEQVVEETDLGNDTAEIIYDVEDEPSQVLAEKVLSAVSNPSPPPDFLSFPDIRITTPPPPEPPETQIQSDNTGAAVSTLTPPTPNDEGVENTLAESLNCPLMPQALGFSSLPSGGTQHHFLPAEGPLVKSTVISSVDPLVRQQTDQEERAATTPEKGKGREIADEDRLAELPTKLIGHSTRRSASPIKRRSPSPEMDRLQPPPRRSARLSVSPHRTPPPDLTVILPQIFPLRPLARDAQPQSDSPEIGPSLGSDPINERLREAEAEERAGRKRKRQDDASNAAGHKRLGSLSPDSQSVLQQLISSSRSSSDEDDNTRAVTPRQSLFGPQRILINRPPTSTNSTHIQTTEPQPHLGTPLRRVLVSPSSVPEDGSSTRWFGQTPFKLQSLDDPNRSPSRRLPIEMHPSSSARKVPPHPTTFSLQPSASNSSILSQNSKSIGKRRSMSEEPIFSRHPSLGTAQGTALPYPLAQKSFGIPEEPEETQPPALRGSRALSEPPATLFRVIPQSTLRQPTTPSRIPRIGTKPYSRPPGTTASKLPVPKRVVPSLTRPLNKTQSSKDAVQTVPKQESFIPISSRKAVGPSSEAPLKPLVKRPLPTKRLPQPPVVAEKSLEVHALAQQLTLPKSQPLGAPTRQIEPMMHEREQSDIPGQSSFPFKDQPTLGASSVRPRSHNISNGEDVAIGRRTTRSRKAPSLLEEAAFGPNAVSPSRPPPKRRPPPDSSGFAGLSITALRNLTTDNTAKNQKVASLLETEIVRREGKRPESPVVKLRTIAEKAKEEKAKQREERAQRRAKRSDSGELELPDTNDLSVEEHRQHRRGAGEEEDYKTPERPIRPIKRLEVDGSEGVETSMADEERRVQWDRLLFTAVSIDEISEKLPRPPDQKLGRGCLSHAAKSIELDRLGNVQDAGLPLPQLPAEKIVVKRYIYDDDPPPEPDKPEEPEGPPAKNTKSKGRKK